MKSFSFFVLLFSLTFLYGADENISKPKTSPPVNSTISVVLPEGIDAKLHASSLSWLPKEMNRVMIAAIRKKKVLIEKVDDFLYVQVIPNFAYLTEDGEQRLGKDLMDILDSGALHIPGHVEIMQLNWSELKKMKLPFNHSLATRTIFPAQMMTLHLDITFFINLNRLTKRLFEMLQSNPLITPVYNSKQKLYRAEIKNSKLIYMVRIPNIAYEVAYTAEPLQNIVQRKIKEVVFLAKLMGKFEPQFEKTAGITWDGRYLKNRQKGIVDIWFLYKKSQKNAEKAEKILSSILSGKNIKITGSEK